MKKLQLIPFNLINIGDKIGNGGNSIVFECLYNEERYAIKI